MAKYLLIESRDPFESNEVANTYQVASGLAGAGDEVTLFLVQNRAALPRMADIRSPMLGFGLTYQETFTLS